MFVNASLLITQIGFCCVYLLFVSENLHKFVDRHTRGSNASISVYMLAVAACLLPYLFVRNLRLLSFFSGFANALTAVGLVLVFAYCLQDAPSYHGYQLVKPIDRWQQSFGIIAFAFEGISIVLPIESRMLRRQEFGGAAGVLQLGMTIVICLYTAVGFYGYLRFNEAVADSITYSLNDAPLQYQIVEPLFAVALFLSYGLQFYVPASIVADWLLRKRQSWPQLAVEAAVRVALLLFTLATAAAVPHLELMIALIGAFSSSCLALVFPPIVDSLLPAGGAWRHAKNACITLFGLLGFAVGTGTTVVQIVQTFSAGRQP